MTVAAIRVVFDCKIPPKYGISAEQTEELACTAAQFATLINDVPEVYRHPLDPDDSAYINLALKADAQLIVSRDRHLLDLSDTRRTVGQDFQARFPNLHIIDPVELLKELE